MVRWRTFQKLLITIAALLIGLVGRTAYSIESEFAVLQGSTLRDGHQVYYTAFDERWLTDEFVAVAEFSFVPNAQFDVRGLQVAVNGFHARVSASEMPNYARWEKRKGIWVLIVDIGRLRFEDGRAFHRLVKRIQRHAGGLHLWLPHARINGSQVYFLRCKDYFPAPILTWDHYPKTWYQERNVHFKFSSSDKAARIECRLDDGKFATCTSPMVYKKLTDGWHRFAARVVAPNGKLGSGLVHSFFVHYVAPPVEITSTTPAESPTSSTSIAIDFKRNSTFSPRAQTECRLDGKAFQICASPFTAKDLGNGDHTFAVRLVEHILWFRLASRADHYAWTIQREALVVQWVTTPPALTNSGTANFEFSSNNNAATFQCALDGAAASTCSSPFELDNLADGVHSLSVTAKDATSGVTSAPISYQWQIDRVAPVLSFSTLMPQQNPTNLAQMNASYTSTKPLSSVTCSFNGATLASCASPIVLNPVPQGNNALQIQATDMAGNVSQILSYDWTVDLTLPTVTIQLVSPTHLPTQSTTASFHLVPSEVSTFQCSLDGAQDTSCGSDVQYSGLIDGQHTFSAVPTDTAGNLGATASFSWTVDTVPPVITLVTVTPPDAVTALTNMRIDFAVSEDAVVTCNLDLGGDVPCSTPFLANGLADGIHTVTFSASDDALNMATPVTYQWQVASTAVAQILDETPSSSLTNSASISFDFASAQSTVFQCALDSGSYASCASPKQYTGLADGNHTFSVQALNASNSAGPAATYSWTVKSSPPTVQITQATPSFAITSQTSMSLTFQGSADAVSYSCQLDSNAAEACTSPMAWTGLTDGSHTASIVAIDAAGNMSQAAVQTWKVQTAPLTVSISVQQITRNTAMIRWNTNFPVTGQAQYGLGGAFDQSSAVITPEGSSQSVVLTGLTSSSQYQVRVFATDHDGRSITSQSVSFATLR